MAYSLSSHFAGQALLDSFTFFTGDDPSNGFVDYQSREDALAMDLVSVDENNRVKLGVDSINTYATSDKGRPSVRITSKDDFTHGLFIADFAHMPGSSCGTWPAFWAFNDQDDGTLWPAGGEVDIIEGANTAQRNLFSAHTEPGCQNPSTGFTGVQGPDDCSEDINNIGCNYAAPVVDSATYGDAFNAAGGGVYALEWDSEFLKIWHFPRSTVPNDIKMAPMVKPNPSSWGLPQAVFGGSSCDPDPYFYNMSLVINTNFCGVYAGQIWGDADRCDELAPTCEEYVAGNPSVFNNAFWQINYIDVYQKGPVPDPVPGDNTTSPFPNSTMTTNGPGATSMPYNNNTVVPSSTRTVTLSTVTPAEPTRTDGGLVDPATINEWSLLGCFGSLAGYQSFSKSASFPTMDNEACVASCASHNYAGVEGEDCYCADILGDARAVGNDMCDIPCPGNPMEFCGGLLEAGEQGSSSSTGMGIALTNSTIYGNGTSSNSTSLRNPLRVDKRAAPSNILLTVYGKMTDDDLPPGAPAMGGPAGPSSTDPKGETVTVTSAVTVTYVAVCPTDSAKLITLEYCTTPTVPITSVPMTTCTETCNACGPHGESTVTLTVPEAVHAGTGGGNVVAITVQTVVPVYEARLNQTNSTFAVVQRAGSVARDAGVITTLATAVGVWFVSLTVLFTL
ncbi:glycoside hydrolase family 16 protein [Xylariaceae sp. FL1019]|nr:glycoside hydrolase family 16 protein [Xylariaceae sp. FL1019]